jgi:hypothetical protein
MRQALQVGDSRIGDIGRADRRNIVRNVRKRLAAPGRGDDYLFDLVRGRGRRVKLSSGGENRGDGRGKPCTRGKCRWAPSLEADDSSGIPLLELWKSARQLQNEYD